MPRGQNRSSKPPIGGPPTPLQKLDKRIEAAEHKLKEAELLAEELPTLPAQQRAKRAENALFKLYNERQELLEAAGLLVLEAPEPVADVQVATVPRYEAKMNITYHTPETPAESTDSAVETEHEQEREEPAMTGTAVEPTLDAQTESEAPKTETPTPAKPVRLVASVPPPFVRKTPVHTKASGPRKGKYDAEVAYAFENPDQHWQIVDGDGEPTVFETTSIKQSMKKKYGSRSDEEGRTLQVVTRRVGDKRFVVWLLAAQPAPIQPEAVNGESVVVGDDDADPDFFDSEGGIVQDN